MIAPHRPAPAGEKAALQAAAVIGPLVLGRRGAGARRGRRRGSACSRSATSCAARPASRSPGEREYVFKHALTREVAYALAADSAARRALHAASPSGSSGGRRRRRARARCSPTTYAAAAPPEPRTSRGRRPRRAATRPRTRRSLAAAGRRAGLRPLRAADAARRLFAQALAARARRGRARRAVARRPPGRASPFRHRRFPRGHGERAHLRPRHPPRRSSPSPAVRDSLPRGWRRGAGRRGGREVDRARRSTLAEPGSEARASAIAAWVVLEPWGAAPGAARRGGRVRRASSATRPARAARTMAQAEVARGERAGSGRRGELGGPQARPSLSTRRSGQARRTGPSSPAWSPTCARAGSAAEGRRAAELPRRISARLTPHHEVHASRRGLLLADTVRGDWARRRPRGRPARRRPALPQRRHAVPVQLARAAHGRAGAWTARWRRRGAPARGAGGGARCPCRGRCPRNRRCCGSRCFAATSRRAERILAEKPAVDLFDVDYPAARLDALAALGDRAGVEPEASPALALGGYVEPFALRALGLAVKIPCSPPSRGMPVRRGRRGRPRRVGSPAAAAGCGARRQLAHDGQHVRGDGDWTMGGHLPPARRVRDGPALGLDQAPRAPR